jgi:DNA-directed RNA polymerase beta' subunit
MDDEKEDGGEDEEGEPIFPDDEVDVHRAVGAPRAANGAVKTSRGRNERIMAPEECRAHLRLLFKTEEELCSLIFGRHGPLSPVNARGLSVASADMFFMEVLSVPPTRFRPPARMGETLFEHAQNELLTRLLNTSYRLRDLNADLRAASAKSEEYDDEARRKLLGQLLEALVQLQVDVNSFIDSSKNPQPVRQGKLPPAGIKQGLEKKEGLFRKNMMVSCCPIFIF